MRNSGYNSWEYYNKHAQLKQALDMIASGYFSKSQPELFKPIIESLLNYGDTYLVLADYAAYVKCQEQVSKVYKNKRSWTKMSIRNVANMGKFSSDRTIKEYAEEIWGAKPISIKLSSTKNSKQ